MNLLFLSATSTLLCILVAVGLKYLSLLRWISGHAYVLSKGKEIFSILEVLDLFKNVKPFPISCQKGWKIDSFTNGHRVWFNFLTFPHNTNAPSIKVYAVFGLIHSSSQALIQVLKDTSQSCEWKPGIISTSHSHSTHSKAAPRGLASVPVHADCVKEETLTYGQTKFDLRWPDQWYNDNVIHTKSLEYRRFWHREDNGVCWLLQMNEKLQIFEFFLIQPVQEMSQCLVTIVTWSRTHSEKSVQWASILLSALDEHISLRRLQKTPLMSITLPQDLSESQGDSSDDNQRHESFSRAIPPQRKKHAVSDGHSSSNSNSSHDLRHSKSNAELKKFSSILKYQSHSGSLPRNMKLGTPLNASPLAGRDASSGAGGGSGEGDSKQKSHHVLQRSVSDGKAVRVSRRMNLDLEQMNQEGIEESLEEDGDGDDEGENEDENISEKDIEEAQYRTISNQCAADIMAEALKASNINLEFTSEQQAQSSGGWFFSSFEKNIVVLKKNSNGSSIQSYIGKGFVLAPPKTVWDAVRNPRTRFTYDETLKKVDIVNTIGSSLKIVYLYHESVQFLGKETYDLYVLQGERQEGEKYILTYSSIDKHQDDVKADTTHAKLLPSGWIIEPAKQDNKVYSIVTYLMQVDFGPARSNSDKLPFQDMIARHPLSIADLQKYLKPAVQLLRRKSMPSAQV